MRISHDAGRAFRWGRHPYLGPLASFHFASRTHGWACSDRFPVVLRTTDGGATWQLPAGTTSSGVWQQKLTAGDLPPVDVPTCDLGFQLQPLAI